jgi:hypothetical protein
MVPAGRRPETDDSKDAGLSRQVSPSYRAAKEPQKCGEKSPATRGNRPESPSGREGFVKTAFLTVPGT